jgi:hypothetical protein
MTDLNEQYAYFTFVGDSIPPSGLFGQRQVGNARSGSTACLTP